MTTGSTSGTRPRRLSAVSAGLMALAIGAIAAVAVTTQVPAASSLTASRSSPTDNPKELSMPAHTTSRWHTAGNFVASLALILAVVLLAAVVATPRASASPHTQVGQAGQSRCSTTANIAVVGDLPSGNDDLIDWLRTQGIVATRVFFDETFLENVSSYDLIILNRANADRGDFLEFLARTDSSGAGVVFLAGGSSGFTSGIGQLWTHLNNPSVFQRDFSSVSIYKFYDVRVAHPILDGFAVGDRIRFDESDFEFKEINWFDGYQGDGRQVVGDAGFWFRGDQVKGRGIGAQERANNRHALLSLHEPTPSFGPSEWNEAAIRIFLNSMEWVAPARTPVDCALG